MRAPITLSILAKLVEILLYDVCFADEGIMIYNFWGKDTIAQVLESHHLALMYGLLCDKSQTDLLDGLNAARWKVLQISS